MGQELMVALMQSESSAGQGTPGGSWGEGQGLSSEVGWLSWCQGLWASRKSARGLASGLLLSEAWEGSIQGPPCPYGDHDVGRPRGQVSGSQTVRGTLSVIPSPNAISLLCPHSGTLLGLERPPPNSYHYCSHTQPYPCTTATPSPPHPFLKSKQTAGSRNQAEP